MDESWTDESEIFDLKQLEEEITRMVDRSYVEEVLKSQIAEYEMLESMFPNPGELTLDDYSVLVEINDYINGKRSVPPPQLDYTIRLLVDGHKLEVCVNLPTEYPNLEPDVFLRSDSLNRVQQRALNNDLGNYISELERGTICIYSIVSWLQENALEYFNRKTPNLVAVNKEKQITNFTRYWVYSHHIYSKMKRREILNLAHEYKLTGFCLPGRPGIICFEGCSSDCEETWQKIKSMNWKKIMCKKVEEVKLVGKKIENFRKFPDFQEVSFEVGGTKKHDFHMDFGEFYKYLGKHECEYIFKDYFGIEGK